MFFFQFVQRNRVDSSRLTMTVLAQIYSTLEQRLKLVQGRHIALLSKQKGKHNYYNQELFNLQARRESFSLDVFR